jgi:hypothetical protein
VELTAWSKDLTVEVDEHGVVSHAGSAVVRMIADGTGLTAGLHHDRHRLPASDRGDQHRRDGVGGHRGLVVPLVRAPGH